MSRSSAEALPGEFYDRPVVEVAEDLIGCTVSVMGSEGTPIGGVIVETEAYHESEPACHAFAGLTPRTETLFGAPGRAYVYRSYGIHALLNAVCEPEGVGAAVLIRALQPLSGVEEMRARRAANGGRSTTDRRSPALRLVSDTDLCSGPGKLTQALGIWLSENGGDLRTGPIRICGPTDGWEESIVAGTRVGITKAVELPWRFCVAGNRHVSSPRPTGWR
ncbi:MAG TPA: DNA-3-methyladenine glycosylase [Solirubrobacteraceae bacterium]|jgi:DNA-3-methyladenine glycosylase|nr:DNA-3-methyladenine glycosylase [Solirubrobacteraceae bacterium]